jgi:3'-phosphoadenosine 5'-phosphosulfate sulfotransferase (PAPS reductase)/FAD synthetase
MKGKESRNISLNCQYIVNFKNPRDKSVIVHIARQMFPTKIKQLQNVFEDATQKPFTYLFIDLKPDTPEKIRLLANIFNENDAPLIVYSI